MGRKVINAKNVPLYMPISSSLVCYLALEKFNAPGWLYGVFGVIFFLLWVVFFADVFTRKELPAFE